MSIVDLEAIPQVTLPFMNDDHREEEAHFRETGDTVRLRSYVQSMDAVTEGVLSMRRGG
jgi:hypothetical protein